MLTVRTCSQLNVWHKSYPTLPWLHLGVPGRASRACACRSEGRKASLNVNKGSKKFTTHWKILSKVAAGGEPGYPVCACNGERFRRHSHATCSYGGRTSG